VVKGEVRRLCLKRIIKTSHSIESRNKRWICHPVEGVNSISKTVPFETSDRIDIFCSNFNIEGLRY